MVVTTKKLYQLKFPRPSFAVFFTLLFSYLIFGIFQADKHGAPNTWLRRT